MGSEDRDALNRAAVAINEKPIAAVAPGHVGFTDGSELAIDAFHVVAPMVPRGDLATQLGVATTDQPNGAGFITAEAFGATSAEGVFAAGDATGAGNVATAIATGSLARTGLHRSLIDQLSEK